MVSSDGFMTVGNGTQVCQCNVSTGNDESCLYNDGCSYEPPYGANYNYSTYNYTFSPQFSPGLIAPYLHV